MKRILTTILLMTSLLLFPVIAGAQGRQVQSQGGVKVQERLQDPATHSDGAVGTQGSGNQIQNQNEIQTRNMGEEEQLQVTTRQMQQMMNVEGLDEQSVREVNELARDQIRAQEMMEAQLKKMESRSLFVKKLLGPDFAAIKSLKGQMEQNRIRIEQLTRLKNKLANTVDTTRLQQAITYMTQENTRLQERIQTEEETGSIFGWFFRIITR